MVGTARKRRRMQRSPRCKTVRGLQFFQYSMWINTVFGFAWSSLLQVRTSQHTYVACRQVALKPKNPLGSSGLTSVVRCCEKFCW